MIYVTSCTYLNINSDGNGGYYLWVIGELNSIKHTVNLDAKIERTLDGKWIVINECEHFWTKNQLITHLNIFSDRVWHNICLTKEIEGIVIK